MTATPKARWSVVREHLGYRNSGRAQLSLGPVHIIARAIGKASRLDHEAPVYPVLAGSDHDDELESARLEFLLQPLPIGYGDGLLPVGCVYPALPEEHRVPV